MSLLQVLVSQRPTAAVVAGLPVAVRQAFRAAKELAPCRLVVLTTDARFAERWKTQLSAPGVELRVGLFSDAALLDPHAPLLALDPEGFPDAGFLSAFRAAAEDLRAANGGDARRLDGGRPVAALLRRAGDAGAGKAMPADALMKALQAPLPEVAAARWFVADTPAAAAAAARELYSRLGNPKDGYLARFDRALSVRLSRLMLPFPVTPNAVTTASLLVGLWGAWKLAGPTTADHFIGAFLLWVCALLDGCDGEIARLKHLSSPSGAAYDIWADHVAHLATFVALPFGVARVHPGTDWTVPGVLLVSGFLACGYTVWKLVLSVPDEERGPLALTVERIASRDYVYLLLVLTALGRLDWFVWAAAYGSHAFWLWLWWQSNRLTKT
ncbi:MAG: CDP-alcohol phosphatidyltransferase family protein [Elusimicrobiota bacterium]|nr:CDP-alcohol phosphatidyltransferase family protein [Elusimicrobiota bacterium]